MSDEDIRVVIKQAIAKVSKIDPHTIGDCASFRDDLGLDSLSILETLVEVQARFKIPDIPDEDFAAIGSVDVAVRFVQQQLYAAVS